MSGATARADAQRAKEKAQQAHQAKDGNGVAQPGGAQTWPEPLDVIGAPELVGWPEISAECLPVPLLRYVMEEAERLNVDPCPLAAHVIAACAASISDAWRVKPKRHDHWTQQARVWTCVVKDVGARGTEIIRSAFWPIRKRENQLFDAWRRDHAAWKEEQAASKKESPAIPSPSSDTSPPTTPR